MLEAAWCLTNIAAGEPEQTQALLPALPLLIAHLGGLYELLRFDYVDSKFLLIMVLYRHPLV